MKIQLLIATAESDYSEFLSNIMSKKYSDTFSVGICSSQEKLNDLLTNNKYHVLLIEPEWIPSINRSSAQLVLALWSEQSSSSGLDDEIIRIHKYQRISALASDILEHYANVAPNLSSMAEGRGKVVAVWSPAGGVGKTSVALAFATRRASFGTSATYLNLEHFSGTDAYFSGEGKSISALFEKLSTNAEILVKSVRQIDSGSGIYYFVPPTNYDDINELTTEDIKLLVDVCASNSDYLVIDLPSVCDKRIQRILEIADAILMVSDGSNSTEAKMNLFCSQYVVFNDNRHKMHLVLNKAAKKRDSYFETAITLPFIKQADPISIFKTLSGNSGLDHCSS